MDSFELPLTRRKANRSNLRFLGERDSDDSEEEELSDSDSDEDELYLKRGTPSSPPTLFAEQRRLRENFQQMYVAQNPPATVAGGRRPSVPTSLSKPITPKRRALSPDSVSSVPALPSSSTRSKPIIPISAEITVNKLKISPLTNLGTFYEKPISDDVKAGFTYHFEDKTNKEFLSGCIKADGSGDVTVAQDNTAFVDSINFAKSFVSHLVDDLGWDQIQLATDGPNALSEDKIKAVIEEFKDLSNFSELDIKIGEESIEDYEASHSSRPGL
tara:strand:- start:514 stop:1329 length:816 start_codon:yes stop_codon:yes gene_type:complete